MSDRRARVNELLATYNPQHQSGNVPSSSSYSSTVGNRASSRLGTDYLDTYTSRRMSNVSDDGNSPRNYSDLTRKISQFCL